MADDQLKNKIKKLANLMETNEILDHEMQDRMGTKIHRDIFIKASKHHVIPKKKFTYIDHDTSGKYLIQNQTDKVARAGTVFGIKAYGQKKINSAMNIDKVLKSVEEKNKYLTKQVMERSLKRRKK